MKNSSRQMVFGALLIACALVLPLAFHLFSQGAGILFSPIQLPVLVAAALLPLKYSLLVAVISPLLGAVLTGMPPLLPMAPLMAVENVAYVTVFSWLLQKKSNTYLALLVAMVTGRIVYALLAGVVFAAFLGRKGFVPVIAGVFVKSWPAMTLQLVVVPLFVRRTGRTGRKYYCDYDDRS